MNTVSFKDFWSVFIKCGWIMLLVGFIVSASLFVWDKSNRQPEYRSTATLYILDSENKTSLSSGSDAVVNDFNLADKIVQDCCYALCSHAVLDTVIRDLQLDMDTDTLKRAISVENPQNTRFLMVSVTADSPQNAKRIADKLCDVGIVKITDIMGFNKSDIFEYGTLNDSPCNGVSKIKYVGFGVLGALLVYFIYFVVYILSDSVKTDGDFGKVLGITLLGTIPNANMASGSRYGKNKKYGYYKHAGKGEG